MTDWGPGGFVLVRRYLISLTVQSGGVEPVVDDDSHGRESPERRVRRVGLKGSGRLLYVLPDLPVRIPLLTRLFPFLSLQVQSSRTQG